MTGRRVTPHRRTTWPTAMLGLAVAIAFLAAATARLFIWPAQGMPGKVSAIVMLAGPGDMLSRAVDLAREHRAPSRLAVDVPTLRLALPSRQQRLSASSNRNVVPLLSL